MINRLFTFFRQGDRHVAAHTACRGCQDRRPHLSRPPRSAGAGAEHARRHAHGDEPERLEPAQREERALVHRADATGVRGARAERVSVGLAMEMSQRAVPIGGLAPPDLVSKTPTRRQNLYWKSTPIVRG